MQDCIFCKIVAGEIPSTKLYEDDNVLVFKDINPVAPQHWLVIPKKHVRDVLDLGDDPETLGRCFTAIQQAVRELGLGESGFRVITNTGPDAGQVVFHLHFHILGGARLARMG